MKFRRFLITPVVLDKNVSFLRVGVKFILKKNSDQDIAEILLRLALNPNQWVICTNKRNIKNTRFPTSLPCIFAMKKTTTKRFT
jgi:hypothetical protein